MRQDSTDESRNMGLVIATELESLKNRLKAEGRDEDADTVRAACHHVREYLEASVPTYRIHRPRGGFRKYDSFSEEEKRRLRPIAETLAMLDGNAFFGMETDEDGDDTWWQYYLPEADAVFEANGGMEGWSGEASFVERTNQ